MEKILWVVGYQNLATFAAAATRIGATGVAIRTDNDLAKAIGLFHARRIKVYGWRWPSARRDDALREAERVARAFDADMDGYYVDPEGEKGKHYDWDRPGLEALADEFCAAVSAASKGRVFGVTSHYRARAIFPNLPWNNFFQRASVFLPQAYWRVPQGPIGRGIPAENYARAIAAWGAAGAERARIVPMAGEIALAKPPEIAEYADAAARHGIGALHFYTYDGNVDPAVWSAIAALQPRP